ncbi:hypothetical protein [Amycolatopsis sp. lyj-346]|uniref:hypothetical protein n=1 Tax=Amycolatopsis sp. lyj-346 TaxID=2789289 RepID=UPI00397B93ED
MVRRWVIRSARTSPVPGNSGAAGSARSPASAGRPLPRDRGIGGAPGGFLFPGVTTLKLSRQPHPDPSSRDVRLDDPTVSTHRLGPH